MADTINVLSLCTGTAMLDEGVSAALQRLGFAPQVLGYCERDAYAAACLLARMEESSLVPAPVWCGNIEDMEVSGLRGRVDVVTAGFPCQPWSSAGKQGGIEDSRWIWPAILRVVMDVAPQLVFLENVPGLVSGGGIEHVLSDLSQARFDADWCHFAAESVGASIGGPGCSSWPSPRSEDSESCGNHPNANDSLTGVTKQWATPKELLVQAASWPTPNSRDHKGSDLDSRNGGASLSHFAQTGQRWHTPHCPRPNDSNNSQSTYLDRQVSSLQDLKTSDGQKSSQDSPKSSRRLNPAFVCWLMGWPWWWTRAEPINSAAAATELWRLRQQQLLSALLSD